MANVVIMPKQGQSVESCIVTEFKKKVGDKVAVGDGCSRMNRVCESEQGVRPGEEPVTGLLETRRT